MRDNERVRDIDLAAYQLARRARMNGSARPTGPICSGIP